MGYQLVQFFKKLRIFEKTLINTLNEIYQIQVILQTKVNKTPIGVFFLIN